ncbi:MAG: hypothetical protein QM654_13605 [Dysgonamonadaceae bacterium]
MKNHSSLFFLLIISLLISSKQYAQNKADTIDALPKRINLFATNYPQEKVYLHFDNTSYYQGENIWFKAYIVRADRHSLSEISKVLYVELVSADGNSVETKKYNIEKGQCHGDFKLPTSSFAGFYEVRAYTRYMLNFREDNYFSRVFPVYDEPKYEGEYKPIISKRPFSQRVPQIRPEYKQKENLSLNFYPEGGNLVVGLPAKVAFKAIGKDGENASVSGIVTDSNGRQAAEFSSSYLGMGSFEFTPQTGKYKAKVEYLGREYSFDLPPVMPSGYSLTVENSDPEKIYTRIHKSKSTAGQILGITFSCRGIVYASDRLDFVRDTLIELAVPKKVLPSGVVQATLYSSDSIPLCERLCFVNHNTQMKIGFSQDKPVYQALEQVRMDFDLKDFKGKPIEATFSLAVRDATTSATNPYDENILTNLLLSSELRGYIENPAYYFKSDSPSLKAALDLLMMTQGWSRYDWKQITGQDTFSIKHPVEKGLVMEGSVLSLFRSKKMPDVDLTMILLSDSLSQHGICRTDSAGYFNFALQDFTGEAKLILQSKKKAKRKEMQIRLDRNFSPPLRSYLSPERNFPQYFKAIPDSISTLDSLNEEQDFIDSLFANNKKLPLEKRNNLLKEVVVKAKRMPVKVNMKYKVAKEMDRRRDQGEWEPASLDAFLYFNVKYYAIGRYKGKRIIFIRSDSKEIVAENNPEAEDLEKQESENTKAPKSQIEKEHGRIPYMDEIESISFIEDYNSIFRLYPNPLDEPSVICLIHCKKNYRKEPIGIRNTYFQGFAPQRQFYSPNYAHTPLPDEKDYRRTLYWNPNVRTDADGKASVSFYNNATCKQMSVSAETVTENGMMGTLNQ